MLGKKKEELTDEQKRIIAEYYEKHTMPFKKRIKVGSIILLISGVLIAVLLFALEIYSPSSTFSLAEKTALFLANLTLLILGVFGLIAIRTEEVFLKLVLPLRITSNVLLIVNILSFLALTRESSQGTMVPLLMAIGCGGMLYVTLAEKNRLKAEQENATLLEQAHNEEREG